MYGMETAINNSKIFNTYNNGTERKYYINFRERVKENNVLLLLSTVSPIIFILSATKATCSRENFVYQMIRLYSIKKEKLNQSTFSPGLPIVQAFCRSSLFFAYPLIIYISSMGFIAHLYPCDLTPRNML